MQVCRADGPSRVVCSSSDSRTPCRRPSMAGRMPTFGRSADEPASGNVCHGIFSCSSGELTDASLGVAPVWLGDPEMLSRRDRAEPGSIEAPQRNVWQQPVEFGEDPVLLAGLRRHAQADSIAIALAVHSRTSAALTGPGARFRYMRWATALECVCSVWLPPAIRTWAPCTGLLECLEHPRLEQARLEHRLLPHAAESVIDLPETPWRSSCACMIARPSTDDRARALAKLASAVYPSAGNRFPSHQLRGLERNAFSGVAMAMRSGVRSDKTVTMASVAEHAGVSVATVSRVIAGHPSVAPAYRAKVDASVRELGYRPKQLAAEPAQQQTEMIGVVVSDIENPHFAEMIHVAELGSLSIRLSPPAV